MTRVTNFGRKRTHFEAGFSIEDNQKSHADTQAAEQRSAEVTADGIDPTLPGPPPKKKRKRTAKTKRDNYVPPEPTKIKPSSGKRKKKKSITKLKEETLSGESREDRDKRKAKEWRSQTIADRAKQTELRRLKRLAERQLDTVCFACRQKGHAAANCPTAQSEVFATPTVGICYRCGSSRHTLSRCKKPTDPANPLPFASCFVCSGQGHLASNCPENSAKGVYPNGGSCKLCGETTHLAKGCGLRKDKPSSEEVLLIGTGNVLGADEDEFHSLKRRQAEADEDEKTAAKLKRLLEVREGAHSEVVQAFGKVSAPVKKKVVVF